jgi:hypothetical protein
MALGAPQLEFRAFDLHVLEVYRNDPRYWYDSSDIGGSVSISTAYSGGDGVNESDKIVLQSFGFAFDDEDNRVVAVYLRYLSGLSPEHQQIWKARELVGAYTPHPGYYQSTILGEWSDHVSLFDAFGKELWLINQMSQTIRGMPLFKRDFGEHGETRPKKFAFLLRPTVEEFNAFALLLDKLLSDNISKNFFEGIVALEEEIAKTDRRYEVRRKGTISLIDEFVRKQYKIKNLDPWDECVSNLKEIRRVRQKPAHAIDEDKFDPQLARDQRELAIKGYVAVRTIRSVLETDSAVKSADIEIPNWLQSGNIWTQ